LSRLQAACPDEVGLRPVVYGRYREARPSPASPFSTGFRFSISTRSNRWEIGEIGGRLPGNRAARVLLCLYRRHLVALHGLIKKTRTTPGEHLALARKRQKELQR
jgi:hypothetical protein